MFDKITFFVFKTFGIKGTLLYVGSLPAFVELLN